MVKGDRRIMRRIILASASARRRDLLKKAGIKADVIPSECDETVDDSMSIEDMVKELSRRKAEEVYSKVRMDYEYQPDLSEEEASFIVIGADTMVLCNDERMGKPVNEDDAFRMIGMLQDNIHTVLTGVTIINALPNGAKGVKTFAEISQVEVYPMSVQEIWDYIDTGEPSDKAGGYAIQGKFSKYIKRIVGDYSNIVGLPLGRVYSELKRL